MKQLSNKDKLNYIYRVACRCDTLEQFRVVRQWIDRIPLTGNWWEQYYDRAAMLMVAEVARNDVFKKE